MDVTAAALPEVKLIQPRVYGDTRGHFFEAYNRRALQPILGGEFDFVQDNQSRSEKGVLRGLHYQIRQAQGKLIRVLRGEIYDVAVDLRRSSPRLGQWVGVRLSAEACLQLWVPPGFGHGFYVLSESADVLYKTTDYYAPEHERSLRWNDAHLGIDWPLSGPPPRLSAKDAEAPAWDDAELFE